MKTVYPVHELIDYVMESEVEDFQANLSFLGISEEQIGVLDDWITNDAPTTNKVKEALAHAANKHIYAVAACLQYGIDRTKSTL